LQSGKLGEWHLYLFVESRVGKIDVFLLHPILGKGDRFAEVSNLSKGHSALEPQGIPAFFIG
jgi:hypothetical protein